MQLNFLPNVLAFLNLRNIYFYLNQLFQLSFAKEQKIDAFPVHTTGNQPYRLHLGQLFICMNVNFSQM